MKTKFFLYFMLFSFICLQAKSSAFMVDPMSQYTQHSFGLDPTYYYAKDDCYAVNMEPNKLKQAHPVLPQNINVGDPKFPNTKPETKLNDDFFSKAGEVSYRINQEDFIDKVTTHFANIQNTGGIENLIPTFENHYKDLRFEIIKTSEKDSSYTGFKNKLFFKKETIDKKLNVISNYFNNMESSDFIGIDNSNETQSVDQVSSFKKLLNLSLKVGDDFKDSAIINLKHRLTGNIMIPNDIIVPILIQSANMHMQKAILEKSADEFRKAENLIDLAYFQVTERKNGFAFHIQPINFNLGNKTVGNTIRNQMNTPWGRELFQRYWEGSGQDYKLSQTGFEKILFAAKHLEYSEEVVKLTDGSIGIRRDFDFENVDEYRMSLGGVTVYYDLEGNPVGFYDRFDFNPKQWNERDKTGELQTRAVNCAGKFYAAEPFNIVYGTIENNPER